MDKTLFVRREVMLQRMVRIRGGDELGDGDNNDQSSGDENDDGNDDDDDDRSEVIVRET